MFLTSRILLLFTIGCLYEWGTVESTLFTLRSCPLASSASILSSSSNKQCSSSRSSSSSSSSRRKGIPYGIVHTYIQIGNQCYDWGNWNYPRSMACYDQDLACCVSTGKIKYTGYSNCADKIGDFETAWKRQKKSYHLWSWNCQVYSDAMKAYLLNNCNVNAVTVFQ